jgi:large subunit ribosomal protein L10
MPLNKNEKKKRVVLMKKAISAYKVIAIASLQNLPARSFNSVKKKLRGKAEIFVARTTLLDLALKEGKPEAYELMGKASGSCAIVATNQNPFELFRSIKSSRSKAKAKPGQIAPTDLVAPAGETSLAPGPVLTELKQAGIQAKIVGTKVVIDKDAVLAKKGEPVSDSASKMLAKLGIEPMEVGLNVLAAWENGTVYPASALDIDDAKFLEELQAAYRHAVNLGVYAEIPNATTTPLIILKAARNALLLDGFVKGKQPKEESSPAAAQQAPAEAAAPAA